MFQLVRNSSKPLGDQLVDELRDLIVAGRLATGSKLPSVRQLARRTGVSPYTVMTAFERLQATGLIVARAGSGYFIAPRAEMTGPAVAELGPSPPQSAALGYVHAVMEQKSISVPAGSGFLPASWYSEGISPSMVSRRINGALARPTSVQGDAVLRELLAERLHARDIPAAPRNIIVTIGASQGFDLIIRALLSPGDAVLIDDPGYFVLLTRLTASGVRLIPVPKSHDGTALDALEELARTERPRMFFTQTQLHNPTGISASPANCHGILQVAEKYNFLVVEDHVHSDLAPAHLVSLARIDELRRVFYVGSYTKVLCPGIRIGFLAAPERFVAQFLEAKVLTLLSCSTLDELVLREVLASGKYRRYLERLRDRLTRARTLAVAALKRSGLYFDTPNGDGLFLWSSVPRTVDVERLIAEARRAGIFLADGALFSPTGRGDSRLRLNVAYAADPLLIDFLCGQLQGCSGTNP
jgi:DNA-binding transcriptional MocR family regulator